MAIEHYEINGRRNIRVTFHNGDAAEAFFCDRSDGYFSDLNELSEEIAKEFYGIDNNGYFSAEARCYGMHVDYVPFFKWIPDMQHFESSGAEECGKITINVDEDQPLLPTPMNVEFNIHQPGKLLIADLMEALSREIKRGRQPVINTTFCGVSFEVRLLPEYETTTLAGKSEK